MTLVVAVPAALGAAAFFGTASAMQHAVAHSQTGGGRVDVRGLGRLLVDRRWLSGAAADGVGTLLQVLALAEGPVSLVEPLHVMGLLVALPVGAMLGGPRPSRRQLYAAAALVAGLTGLLLLVGDPGGGQAQSPASTLSATLMLLAATAALLGMSRGRSATVRAATHGLAAGALFAMTAALLRQMSLRLGHGGDHHLLGGEVLVPLACLAVVGVLGIATAQAGFQVGPLAASLPAETAADVVGAVILGTVLLDEQLTVSPVRILGLTVSMLVVIGSARYVARESSAEIVETQLTEC